MIEINKNKLVPAITATWGDITGNIEKQQDLMSLMSSFATESWVLSQHYLSSAGLDAYATKEWVSDQGYLTSETLPSDLATESWVSSQGYITTSALSGYATESWVSSQGYLTSVPDSFATKAWVSDQGYLTSETLPSDLATESWVLSQGFASAADLSAYATQSWVESKDYLSEEDPIIAPLLEQETVLEGNTATFRDVGINSTRIDGYVYKIGGYIYYNGVDDGVNKIYKFNSETRLFEFVCYSPTTDPMWEDNSGTVHIGNIYTIDLSTGESSYVEMGGTYISSLNRHNIVKIGDLIYMIDTGNSVAYIFDQANQTFWNYYVPCDCSYSSWYQRQLNFNGHIVYVRSGNMYELVPYFENEGDTYPTRLDCVQLSVPYYPILGEGLPTSSYVAKANDVWYYLGKSDHTIYYLDEHQNQWVQIQDFTVPYGYTISLNGAFINDDYILGFGFDETNRLLIWYFGESQYEYKFIADLEDKIDAVDSKIPADVASQTWVISQNYANYSAVQNELALKADKTDVILNNTTSPFGPNFTANGAWTGSTDMNRYWNTPSGRVFYWNDYSACEFSLIDGVGTWTNVNLSFLPSARMQMFNTGTNLFYIDPDNSLTYIWDDANTDWVQICAAPTEPWDAGILITTDDTLRCIDGTKLTYNNGVWSWEQSAMVDQFISGFSILVGSTVYVFAVDWDFNVINTLYTYDESTTTYTQIGYLSDKSSYDFTNIFTIDGELLYTDYSDTVPVIKKWDVDTQTELVTDGYCENILQPYMPYDGMLWTRQNIVDDWAPWGYIGGISYSKPEVPASNGTYVLKATRTSAGVTYEWVADEVPQAVQITNEILS